MTFPALIDWLDDRLNPIVVKELVWRQLSTRVRLWSSWLKPSWFTSILASC